MAAVSSVLMTLDQEPDSDDDEDEDDDDDDPDDDDQHWVPSVESRR